MSRSQTHFLFQSKQKSQNRENLDGMESDAYFILAIAKAKYCYL